ncbi:NAD(P)(+) transhydrogenase (Re/Si-specific) subunit beta [Halosimplex salinum]|uniref:NAD(P)(+) transhydrogenase (Re/Si-specific) subunit beta n=1 Tax=Halosimplex salinum TaxID=1710538 RepID=UPI000F49BC9B|nr:NAD(P)(+) transhydrogenase (Re/Si-specific) subunit beta [Halosimplex salinum]
MSDATDDVDPEELQRQLSEIKGAMGLAEQYPGRARLWLFAGLLIGVAALLVQVTFFYYEALGDTEYTAVWLGFVAVAGVATWWMSSRVPRAAVPETAPSWRAVFGSLAAFLVAAAGVVGEAATQVGGLDRALVYFGLVIATVGLGLLVTGAVLSSYRVRRRDRLVFYAGGVWVLVYASVLPYPQILRWVGVGLFGVLFIVYAIVAYVYLTRA